MATDATLWPAQSFIDQARQTANMERNPVVSDDELLVRLRLGVAELYDLLVDDGDTYFMVQLDGQTLDSTRRLYFPDNFYKFLGVDYQLNGFWTRLDPIPFDSRNDYRYNFNIPAGYQLRGERGLPTGKQVSYLQILPEQFAPLTGYRVFYVPKPLLPMDFADKIDGINGYEKFLIADLAGFMLTKTPRLEDAAMQWGLCNQVRAEIKARKSNRMLGQPQHVTVKTNSSRWNYPIPILPRN